MKKAILSSLAASSLVALCFIWTEGTNASGTKAVTFNKDVAPILYKNCVQCHRPNDLAPMSLITYKEARPWARSIKEKVLTREMPPWHADPHYGKFENEARLTQQDIDTLAAWVDQGAKEGNPRDLPPAPAFNEGWQIGKPDLVLTMGEDYTVAAEGADDYIYFRIPTGLTEDKWIQAAEFRPGNRKVVHHAVVFIESPDLVNVARRNASRTGQTTTATAGVPSVFEADVPPFVVREGTVKRMKPGTQIIDDACGANRNSSSNGGGELLCVWAPGRNPDVWPAGTAKRVPAGSNIILQMHYSKTSGKPEKDRTSVALLFAKAPVEKMIVTRDVTNFFFNIPAGAENHEVTACYTFARDVQFVNYMPHMHVRGKDMKYEVVYPDGRRETLLWVPSYSFAWQTLYKLKEPVTIPKGTKMIVTAHYDNSSKNKNNPDPSKAVRFGEPTYDEMMIGFVDYITDKPRERVVAKLDPKVLDAYVGEYSVGPGIIFQVLREGDKLLVEVRGQRVEIYPESETSFFLKALEGQVSFVKNEKGEVTEMVFERADRVTRAKRVNKPAPAAGSK